MDVGIRKLLYQLALQLIRDRVAQLRSGGPFLEQLKRISHEFGLGTALQGRKPHPALIELKTGKPLVPGKGVHQQRNAERVEHFNTGHIDVSSAGILEVEGKKAQVIVRIKHEPNEF